MQKKKVLEPREAKERLRFHEKFEAYLKQSKLRQTKQRQVILDIILSLSKHFDVETLLSESKKVDKSIGVATIYRNLQLLDEAKIIATRHFEIGKNYFEIIDLEEKHHDHLICNDCGEIIEFFNKEIEDLQEKIVKGLGFKLTHHKMDLFADCLKKRSCKFFKNKL
jgi:Fur family ferric uptake transcriptional regulator